MAGEEVKLLQPAMTTRPNASAARHCHVSKRHLRVELSCVLARELLCILHVLQVLLQRFFRRGLQVYVGQGASESISG